MAKKKQVKTGEGKIEMEDLDPKYLKGLTFTTSQAKKIKGEDGEKTKWTPVERDLTLDDVLDWNETDDSVTLVTADGKKYVVKKGK